MTCLVDENGFVSQSQKKILQMQAQYYSKLYTSDTVIEFQFDRHLGPKLTDEEKQKPDEEITIDEAYKAPKRMRCGRTPGCDGLGPEIYLHFWDQLCKPLIQVTHFAYEKGTLHLSARRGIINLILKKNRDPVYLKNWRPLTLLNTDYEIIAKIIALCIQP